MDIKTKLGYAVQQVKSIGGHETEDAAVRVAVLDSVIQAAKAEQEKIRQKLEADIAAKAGR